MVLEFWVEIPFNNKEL
jgi:hypothetical protein